MSAQVGKLVQTLVARCCRHPKGVTSVDQEGQDPFGLCCTKTSVLLCCKSRYSWKNRLSIKQNIPLDQTDIQLLSRQTGKAKGQTRQAKEHSHSTDVDVHAIQQHRCHQPCLLHTDVRLKHCLLPKCAIWLLVRGTKSQLSVGFAASPAMVLLCDTWADSEVIEFSCIHELQWAPSWNQY